MHLSALRRAKYGDLEWSVTQAVLGRGNKNTPLLHEKIETNENRKRLSVALVERPQCYCLITSITTIRIPHSSVPIDNDSQLRCVGGCRLFQIHFDCGPFASCFSSVLCYSCIVSGQTTKNIHTKPRAFLVLLWKTRNIHNE